MSLQEALAEGLQVTAIGLIIVFAVLIILMLVMMAMKVIFYKEDKKPVAKPAAPAEKKAEAPKPKQTAMNEEELVAVITAAIAASLNTSTYNLKVKSFRRVANTSPSWNRAGVSEVIESRF